MSTHPESPTEQPSSLTPQTLFYHVKNEILAISGAGFLNYASTPEVMDIFPTSPPGSPTQTLTISREELYGNNAIPHGRDANDVISFSAATLRDGAIWDLQAEGFTPA